MRHPWLRWYPQPVTVIVLIVAPCATMPTNCIACGCLNRAGEVEGVTFHSFPKDENARRKWILATRRKDWEPSKYSRICSAHFREKDIDRTSLSCVRIREGAVPVIFPVFPQEVQADEISSIGRRVSRKKRSEKLKVSKLEEEAFHHPGSPNSKKIKIEIDSDGEGGGEGEEGGGGAVDEEEEENKEDREEKGDEEEMNEPASNGGAVNGCSHGDDMIDIDESALLQVKRELISDDLLEPQVSIKVEEPSDVDEDVDGDRDVNGDETEASGNDGRDNAANLEEPNRVFLTVKQEFASINEDNGLELEQPFAEEEEEEEEDSSSGGGGGEGGEGGIRWIGSCCSNDDIMLINAVRQYRELYDSWHLYYSNSWRRNDCWALVAKQLNWTAEECRRRWNQVRDNYRKSRRRTDKTTGGPTVRMHRLDDHLSFLDDFCRPRRQYLVGDSNDDDHQIVFNTENGSDPPPPPVLDTTTCESVTSSTCESADVAKKRRTVEKRRVIRRPQDSETTSFLELYAREQLLYDTGMKQYRDQEARLAAAQRISDALNVADFGPKDVAKRFKNLRDSYCYELKKKAEWERSNPVEPYVPKLFYFDQINAFLRPFVQHRTSSIVSSSKLKSQPPLTDNNPNNIETTTTTTNNNMTIMTDHHLHHSGVMLEQNMVYHSPPTNIPFSNTPHTNIPFSNIPPTNIPFSNRPPPPPYPNHSLLLQLQAPLVGGTVNTDKLLSVIAPTTVTVPPSPPEELTVPVDVDLAYQSSNSSLSPPMVIDADPLALDPLEMEDNSDCSSLMEPAMLEAFSDHDLVELPTRELNRRLRGLPDQVVRRLKMKRRTLKNRSYANNSRTKRSNRSHQLEMQNKELMDKLTRFEMQLIQVRAERDFYKKQFQTLRGAVSPDRLTVIGDCDQPQSLAQLLLQLPSQSPPPLRPLSPKMSEQLSGTGRSQLSKEQLAGSGRSPPLLWSLSPKMSGTSRSQLAESGRSPPPLRPLSPKMSEQLSGICRSQLSESGRSPKMSEQLSGTGRSQLSNEQLSENGRLQLSETGPQLSKEQSRLPVVSQLLGQSPLLEQLSESGRLLNSVMGTSQSSETVPRLSKEQLPVESQPETDKSNLGQSQVKSPPSLEPLSPSQTMEPLQSPQKPVEPLPAKSLEESKLSLKALPEPVQSQERLLAQSPDQLPEKSPEQLKFSQSQSPEQSPTQSLADSKSPEQSPIQSLEQAKSPEPLP